MPPQPPPQAVLTRFGVAGLPVGRLAGGQGTSWRAGDLVFKPADVQVAELEWLAEVLSQIECDGFRVARPRLAADGSVCVHGWCATEYVAGQHAPGRWPEVMAVGDRFHAALAGIARPGFLDQRDSPWAIGDRVAWEELPAGEFAQVSQLDRLVAARRPVSVSSVEDFCQYLIRALIYRSVTDWLFGGTEAVTLGSNEDPWLPAVSLACQLATG